MSYNQEQEMNPIVNNAIVPAPIPAQTPQERFNEMTIQMMEIIEQLSSEELINDGRYLTMTNLLMQMRNVKTQMTTNTIYIEIQREVARRREGRVDGRKNKTSLAQKLNNDNYDCCRKCHSFIKKGTAKKRDAEGKKQTFLQVHQQTAKCNERNQIKLTTYLTKQFDKNPSRQEIALVMERFFREYHNHPLKPVNIMTHQNNTQEELFARLEGEYETQEGYLLTMAEALGYIIEDDKPELYSVGLYEKAGHMRWCKVGEVGEEFYISFQ